MASGAVLTPNASPKHAGQAATAPGPAAMLTPFVRSSREHVEPGGLDKTVQLNATSQELGSEDVSAFGYLRSVVVIVDCGTNGTTDGVNGGSANVAAQADAPWCALQNIALTDANGAAIVQLTGYSAYLAHKFGGGAFNADPTSSPQFTNIATGTGSTGKFSFLLRIPVEIVAREGLGALENMSASTVYKLRITVAPSTSIYSTAPATLPFIRVRSFIECWTPPAAADPNGVGQAQAPEGLGTTQFWTATQKSIVIGQNEIQHSRIGNLIRMLIYVYRDSTNTRSTTKLPDPLQYMYDGQVWTTLPRVLWLHYLVERYGYAAANIDTGVLVAEFCHEWDGHPGGELADLWVGTTPGTRLSLLGSFVDTGSLTVITNDVNPGPGVQL